MYVNVEGRVRKKKCLFDANCNSDLSSKSFPVLNGRCQCMCRDLSRMTIVQKKKAMPVVLMYCHTCKFETAHRL